MAWYVHVAGPQARVRLSQKRTVIWYLYPAFAREAVRSYLRRLVSLFRPFR